MTRDDLIELLKLLENESAMTRGRVVCWQSERICMISKILELADHSNFFEAGTLCRPLVLNDARLYARYIQELKLAFEAPIWPVAQKLLPTALLKDVKSYPYFHPALGLIMTSLGKLLLLEYRNGAERRLASLAVAVRLYAADHGDQLPSTLADLVPAYLPAIPIDPMSGKPLHYKLNPPMVYSVGNDGIDHGGTLQPERRDVRHPDAYDDIVYLVTQPRVPHLRN